MMGYRYIYKDKDLTEAIGSVQLLDNKNKQMKNGIGKLSWENIKSALVYGGLMLGLSFILALLQNILDAKSIFSINWKFVINNSVIAVLPLMITGISLLKNFFTTEAGNFAGVIKVIPPTE